MALAVFVAGITRSGALTGDGWLEGCCRFGVLDGWEGVPWPTLMVVNSLEPKIFFQMFMASPYARLSRSLSG
jgi:hypothetical protein